MVFEFDAMATGEIPTVSANTFASRDALQLDAHQVRDGAATNTAVEARLFEEDRWCAWRCEVQMPEADGQLVGPRRRAGGRGGLKRSMRSAAGSGSRAAAAQHGGGRAARGCHRGGPGVRVRTRTLCGHRRRARTCRTTTSDGEACRRPLHGGGPALRRLLPQEPAVVDDMTRCRCRARHHA